jgi:hypothetical protein
MGRQSKYPHHTNGRLRGISRSSRSLSLLGDLGSIPYPESPNTTTAKTAWAILRGRSNPNAILSEGGVLQIIEILTS